MISDRIEKVKVVGKNKPDPPKKTSKFNQQCFTTFLAEFKRVIEKRHLGAGIPDFRTLALILIDLYFVPESIGSDNLRV